MYTLSRTGVHSTYNSIISIRTLLLIFYTIFLDYIIILNQMYFDLVVSYTAWTIFLLCIISTIIMENNTLGEKNEFLNMKLSIILRVPLYM